MVKRLWTYVIMTFVASITLLGVVSCKDDTPNEPYYPDDPTEEPTDEILNTGVIDDKLPNGIYLGIQGFNQSVYDYKIQQLDKSTIEGFNNFINDLTMQNGTLLYYSVEQALNALSTTPLPKDVSTVALVTFTDGLDQGSMMKNDKYSSDEEYLNALNKRILTTRILGDSISAYSIGVKGNDVSNKTLFRENLRKLASAPENATEVTSMEAVNSKFQQIAQELSQSSNIQTINLKMPGLADGTRVRFTFDNINAANKSQIYIEGKFNLKEKSLEEVQYVGLTATSGTTVKGKVEGIFVNFTFEGVRTKNNKLIESKYTDEWTYITSNDSWQINSEFDKSENSEIITKRSSAVIMLVLDCSSSLGDQFDTAKKNAQRFIQKLYEAVPPATTDNPSKPNEPTDPTTSDKDWDYSSTPKDLSVSVWRNNKRYYLTTEEYKAAKKSGGLTNATTEGLVVLATTGNFIISPDLIQSQNVIVPCANEYYSDVLPDQTQATVISARYRDINSALESVGFKQFSTNRYSCYLTKTSYKNESEINYSIYLYDYTGGKLYDCSSGLIRGVKSIPESSIKIIWNNENDMAAAYYKAGELKFTFDPNELRQADSIEGICIWIGKKHFILKMKNEQSGEVTVSAAMSLYFDILPDREEGSIISMKYYDINRALEKFGGSSLSTSRYNYYLTKTSYNNESEINYSIYLYEYTGGKLYDCSSGLIRGVKRF